MHGAIFGWYRALLAHIPRQARQRAVGLVDLKGYFIGSLLGKLGLFWHTSHDKPGNGRSASCVPGTVTGMRGQGLGFMDYCWGRRV